MTLEDKAKAYDEAIKRAKDYAHNTLGAEYLINDFKEAMEV